MGRKLFPLLILTLLMVGRVLADDNPWTPLLHTKEIEKHVLVIHSSNMEEIDKLAKDPQQWKICDVQFEPDKLSPAIATTLLAWVQQGGSLWFQDSRMADKFGMQADPIAKAEIFNSGTDDGRYNTHSKLKGLAAEAFAMDNNDPLLTDVNAVGAFLIPLGNDQYPGVKAGGDVIGLLRAAPNPEAADADKMIAAYRHVGSGTVVFKPLVWIDSLASDRFQTNLREWVCGYPIPNLGDIGGGSGTMSGLTPHGTSSPTVTADQVTLDTGKVLEGQVENRTFRCIGGAANNGGLDRAKLQSIELGGADDVVHLKSGESLHGIVDFGDEDLNIKLTDGSTRHLRKDEVKRIEFGGAENVHG
ncbi:MAG TPA: hypothetical protein VGO93_30155 [Candidatus Xenobia bacterium]|jgi:hypothetical protein